MTVLWRTFTSPSTLMYSSLPRYWCAVSLCCSCCLLWTVRFLRTVKFSSSIHVHSFVVVQFLSRIWLFATPCTAACQASLSFTIWSLLKLMSIESVMLSNISSSDAIFSSCPRSFPASGSFPVSQFFASGGPSTGASASASVLPVNIQGWFPLGLTGLISLLSKGLSRVFSWNKSEIDFRIYYVYF